MVDRDSAVNYNERRSSLPTVRRTISALAISLSVSGPVAACGVGEPHLDASGSQIANLDNRYLGPHCTLAAGEEFEPVSDDININEVAYLFSGSLEQVKADAQQVRAVCEPGIDPADYSPDALFRLEDEDNRCVLMAIDQPGDLIVKQGQQHKNVTMVCLDDYPLVASKN